MIKTTHVPRVAVVFGQMQADVVWGVAEGKVVTGSVHLVYTFAPRPFPKILLPGTRTGI